MKDLGLLLLLLLLVLGMLGCEASAIQNQARGAIVVSGLLTAGGAAVDEARSSALDEVERQHPEPGIARTTALELEHRRWLPVGAALDSARSALLTWVRAIELAHLAGGDDADVLAPLAALVARVVLAYDDAARLARSLGADIPALPESIRELAEGLGG